MARRFVRLAAPRPYVFNKSCYLFTATTESSVFGNLKGCKNVAGGKAAGRHPRRHSPNRFDPEGVTQRAAFLKKSPLLSMFLPVRKVSVVGTSRCDVPARTAAGGTGRGRRALVNPTVAPLNAARTAQRAIPTRFRGSMREIFRGNLLLNHLSPDPATGGPPSPRKAGRGPGE